MKDEVIEARAYYTRAYLNDPRHLGVVLNLATIANEAGDVEEAASWLEKAAALRPGDPEVRWRTGLVELAMGDFENGWLHHEAGLFDPAMRGPGPGFITPPWDGTPCDRLLVWHEQGFGDTIQFVRYAALCRRRARRVLVLCPAELVPLLARCPFVDEAVASIGAEDFDEHVAMMSLPHRFATTLADVPSTVPYCFAEPSRVARWSACMRGDAVRVGLVWAGGVRADQTRFRVIDRHRNVPWTMMARLLDVDGAAFYSLQVGPARRERAETSRKPVVDWMDDVVDFADTAALVECLDLVVTVDTAVAHLAGAMGKPVFVLSRRDACWRRLQNRPDSPWYPTARVFGQRTRGRWDDVLDDVVHAVRAFVAERQSRIA